MNNPSQKPGNKGKSVQTLMRQRNTSLGNILTHARVLNRLDNRLEAILDPTLSPHCQVADFRNHSLILVCSSATFATRIRMITQQLLDSFKEEGEHGVSATLRTGHGCLPGQIFRAVQAAASIA
jgi:hypothetical protein